MVHVYQIILSFWIGLAYQMKSSEEEQKRIYATWIQISQSRLKHAL